MRESLLKHVPTYKVSLGEDAVMSTYLGEPYVTTSREIAESARSRVLDSSGYGLDPDRLCCYRVAQLALAHSLFQGRYMRRPFSYDSELFRSQMISVLTRPIPPTSFTEVRLNFFPEGDSYATLWQIHQIREHGATLGCFLLNDLQPRAEHAVLMEDFVPILRIFTASLFLSTAWLLDEILRASFSWAGSFWSNRWKNVA